MSARDVDAAPHLVCSAVPPEAESLRFDPAWQTSTVLAIGRGIVAELDFSAMPILADALEDAGCDYQTLLDHCRHGTQHQKCCWVLHLIVTEQPPSPSQAPLNAAPKPPYTGRGWEALLFDDRIPWPVRMIFWIITVIWLWTLLRIMIPGI